ncbi:hypothetical protein GMORB2_5412 [Geosmithia morbida]|uniref:Uncharacterized protein n=1 Tax=Geosmithia morbida TaxID=1094350 RepID=A0A9P4YX81_9HYPO|nr:uncharacterized protein GMORB2_5412 [Geosmithia morbida]KAF4124746.1 hypothetical protein GMORB2_5412 [Geosmithia morbida]
MSGYSNVGQSSVYEAGDQRNIKTSDLHKQETNPYAEGQANSHINIDSKDERSIANRLAAEEKRDKSSHDDPEVAMSKKDPTLPVGNPRQNRIMGRPSSVANQTQAVMHGNEPSKGAKIDAELREEEEAIMAKKK